MTMIDLVSVESLIGKAKSFSQRTNLELLLGVDHARMITLVDEAVDYVSSIMAQNPELKQAHTEDELTIDLIFGLTCLGFKARHEPKIGGHCDISIEDEANFLWLAEAKKFDSDYSWLMKGFNQLCSRYSTGTKSQDNGSMIIYVFARRTDRILERWAERMRKDVEDIVVDTSTKELGFVRSVHPHRRTGLPYKIRHKAISLLWEPE